MGGWNKFGKLAHVRHQVWYTLAPNELKPFAGYFSRGFPNLLRRVLQEAPYVLPPMIIAYGIYTYTMNASYQLGRKQPGQFDSPDAKPAH